MRVAAGSVELEVEDRGPPGAPAVLLIMGLGMQLLGWPDELVDNLLARGFRVLRFDNRDIGLSQHFDHLGVPNLALASLRYALRLPVAAPYTLAQMAHDTEGLLAALNIQQAHVVGASMGGMIAQHLAASHPHRVASLTLVMTTSGARHLPQPAWPVRRALLSRPDGHDPQAVVAHLTRLLGVIGSPAYRPTPERLRARLEAMVSRSWRPQGTARQLVAVAADGDRRALLRRITQPTHVIHGDADPLVPVAAGRELAALIGGATLDVVPGMGHDLPLPLLPRLADGISRNAARAAGGSAAV
jgi:pimeloyl-ACP methyl ester carboxylesterase